ncbi:hypothetical protein JNUCC0626_50365 (plasmid) [Lentzea sp. JNUCC 0626]|uniref:hypothetical protein n=1 Tax=Lentzea sp. JNUCC 0626 TaxID=3367513 RepID=UPI0037486007
MPNPFGYAGVFRYSDQYPKAVEPWWEPDDNLEDVADELRELTYDELTSPTAAEFEAHRDIERSDYRVRAAVFMLPSPPWPVKEGQRWAWILYWEDDSEINVVEHPDRDTAVAAFFAHVAFCEAEGTRYDYVVNPRQPKTAMPPGWKPRPA